MEYVKISVSRYESLKKEAKTHEDAYNNLLKALEDQDKIFKVDLMNRWDRIYNYTFCETVKSEIECLNKQINMLEKDLKTNWFTRLKSRLCNLLNCSCNE